MLLSSLLITPIVGTVIVSMISDKIDNFKFGKSVALIVSLINLGISSAVFILFNFSSNQFQFVREYHEISSFDFYLGVDGISIYFVLLTTIIMPISLLSNWSSIVTDTKSYVIIMLLLETLLLAVFVVIDILMFYVFFESILAPLFILIGIFGSNNRVRASFYLFLYTLLGSLFLLLSILSMSSTMGATDLDALFKTNFGAYVQIALFSGVFIAFAVKTPTIFLNSWLLKAHVESPLGGSIVLAAIVLKLSLYGIFRLILPLLPKAYMYLTSLVFAIGVITILYASLSTLRTIDIKELIAYSSVSHAAVYLLGVFSNTIQGIEGGIVLGLAHGFVSSGLFICAGGVLYDRSSTRLITFYRGMTQLMPLFSILFFILCLGNAGTPLSLNFIGEFMSLYGTFERLPPLGVFASSSIVFSAAYTIYMFNRISFGGSISKLFLLNVPDLSKREFYVLTTLVIFTVFFGIYPSPILDGLHYGVSCCVFGGELALILPITLSVNSKKKRFYTTAIRSIDDAELARMQQKNLARMEEISPHSPITESQTDVEGLQHNMWRLGRNISVHTDTILDCVKEAHEKEQSSPDTCSNLDKAASNIYKDDKQPYVSALFISKWQFHLNKYITCNEAILVNENSYKVEGLREIKPPNIPQVLAKRLINYQSYIEEITFHYIVIRLKAMRLEPI